MLKVTGRLGKSMSKETRHKNQDIRARFLKSNPSAYFQYAVQAIIEEEALYNESIDYVLGKINVSQDSFFNIQSVYMNDPKFCEALTKIDMETLPIEEEDESMEESKSPRLSKKVFLFTIY
jgi:hypothetical protein